MRAAAPPPSLFLPAPACVARPRALVAPHLLAWPAGSSCSTSARRAPCARPSSTPRPAGPAARPERLSAEPDHLPGADRATAASPCTTTATTAGSARATGFGFSDAPGFAPQRRARRQHRPPALRLRRQALPRRRRLRRRVRRRLLRGVLDRQPRSAPAASSAARWSLGSDGRRRPRPRRSAGGPAAACCARCRGWRTRPASWPRAASTPGSSPSADPDLDRLVSSFNDMADAVQEPDRAGGPLRLRRQPRAALADHRAVGRRRGARRPARRPARAQPAGARRRRQPGAAASTRWCSTSSSSPALDAGVDRDAPRAGPARRHPAARSPPATATPTCPSRSTAAGRTRRSSIDKRRLERIVANLLENAKQHAGGPVAHRRRATATGARAPRRRGRRPRRARRSSGTASSSASPAARRPATASAPASAWPWSAEHARLHGGRAWVEDRPGGGARFVVSFPGVRA